MTGATLDTLYKNLVEKNTAFSKKDLAEIEAKSKVYAKTLQEIVAAECKANYHQWTTTLFLAAADRHKARISQNKLRKKHD